MWLAVFKPFGWHEVKQGETKEDVLHWWEEREKQLRRTHPKEKFVATIYEVRQVVKVGGP